MARKKTDKKARRRAAKKELRRRSGMDPAVAKALAEHRLVARDELHEKRMKEQEVRLAKRGPSPNRANQFLRAYHIFKRQHPGVTVPSPTAMQELGLL